MANFVACPPADAVVTPIPTLHHLTSSQSLRVLWALEEISLFHNQPYNLKVYKRQKGRAPPELKTIFPLGKSPILEIEGIVHNFPAHNFQNASNNDAFGITPTRRPSGAVNITTTTTTTTSSPGGTPPPKTIVTESRLILQYLADHYSRGLWTPSTRDQARDTYWQEFANCTLVPIVERILIFDLISSSAPLLARPLTWPIFHPFVTLFKKDLAAPLDLMENALADAGRPWFAGRSLGLADFCMSWPMDLAAQRKFFDPNQYPSLADWLRRVHAREAYQRAIDKSGSYDLITFDM